MEDVGVIDKQTNEIDQNVELVNNTEKTESQKSTTNDMLIDLAKDYAGFISVDLSKEKLHFSESVDDLLTKLDEFIGLTDLIRSDVNLALNSTLNEIHAKSKEMEKHFDRIDRLEAFVVTVKKNVNELEAAVDKAESEFGTISSIKRVVNSITLPSFLSTSKPSRTPTTAKLVPMFSPIEIFRTEDFFLPSVTDGVGDSVGELTSGLDAHLMSSGDDTNQHSIVALDDHNLRTAEKVASDVSYFDPSEELIVESTSNTDINNTISNQSDLSKTSDQVAGSETVDPASDIDVQDNS